MKVKLFACTQPIKDRIIGLEDVQDVITYCAKVSNPQFQTQFENSERLINYLIKHQHWSPFEMASATLEIETTRDIARQMLRHTSFRFQEFSQRYQDVTVLDESFVIREARLQHPTNRQDSIQTDDEELQMQWAAKQQQIIHEAKMAYKWALEQGIAKEQARCVLPEGNTVSRLYMQGTIRSWIHYIQLRSGNGTQREHMEIAREVARAIAEIFPLSMKFISEDKNDH
jgi:thymidylate synthase (FAD)